MDNSINKRVLKGEKIYLGTALPEDNKIIWEWMQDDDYYQKAFGSAVHSIHQAAVDAEEAEFNKTSSASEFRIRENGTGRMIGLINLTGIDRDFGSAYMNVSIGKEEDRGKGYGAEAIRLIVNYAFKELRLHRVALSVYEYNPRAFELYKRLGFKEEGRARQAIYRNGQYFDIIGMGLLEGELRETNEPTQKERLVQLLKGEY